MSRTSEFFSEYTPERVKALVALNKLETPALPTTPDGDRISAEPSGAADQGANEQRQASDNS